MSENPMVAAFIKAQQAFKPAVKDAVNPHYKSKYVTLQGVIDAVLPALHANGFGLIQRTSVVDGRTILRTELLHVSNECLVSDYPVHPAKADPQGEGSALTYARRYALMALCGIAPEDDDGNAAATAAAKAAAEPQAQVVTFSAAVEKYGEDFALVGEHLDDGEYEKAYRILHAIPKEYKDAIWIAPTKVPSHLTPVFTTKHREQMKSQAWSQAREAVHNEELAPA